MHSMIDICNRALATIRGKSINSITESSIEAQQCKLWYEFARDTVLSRVDWAFARKTIALALRAEAPLQWVYAYAYPSDCLKLRVVTGPFAAAQSSDGLASRSRFQTDIVALDPSVPYAIENINGAKVVVTNQEQAYGVYTVRVTDTSLFDDLFCVALSYQLAAMIAVPVIGGDFGKAMRNDALTLYRDAISDAVAANQNEQTRPPERLPSMVEARR